LSMHYRNSEGTQSNSAHLIAAEAPASDTPFAGSIHRSGLHGL